MWASIQDMTELAGLGIHALIEYICNNYKLFCRNVGKSDIKLYANQCSDLQKEPVPKTSIQSQLKCTDHGESCGSLQKLRSHAF